jgi:hypothetical protein
MARGAQICAVIVRMSERRAVLWRVLDRNQSFCNGIDIGEGSRRGRAGPCVNHTRFQNIGALWLELPATTRLRRSHKKYTSTLYRPIEHFWRFVHSVGGTEFGAKPSQIEKADVEIDAVTHPCSSLRRPRIISLPHDNTLISLVCRCRSWSVCLLNGAGHHLRPNASSRNFFSVISPLSTQHREAIMKPTQHSRPTPCLSRFWPTNFH